MTEEEFFEPIKDDYARELSKMGLAELDDGYNPGKYLFYIFIV